MNKTVATARWKNLENIWQRLCEL